MRAKLDSTGFNDDCELYRAAKVEPNGPRSSDQLMYVKGVVKGKFLENGTLMCQAVSNGKEQFANLPALKDVVLNAIMDALRAYQTMSTQSPVRNRAA